MISFMFKALMVLTFGVISNQVCYTLVCFYMLFLLFFFLFFGYTTLLFVNNAEMKDPFVSLDRKESE